MQQTNLGELTVSAQGLGCTGMSEGYGTSDWDCSVATTTRGFASTSGAYRPRLWPAALPAEGSTPES
jgi:hypothetical protein